MEISTEKKKGLAVVKIIGSLDADTVQKFKCEVAGLTEGGAVKFIVDVSDLDFIDSVGLGSLISLLRHSRSKGGDVRLFGINKNIKEIFEITRLDKLFLVFVSEAMAAKDF